MFHFSTKITNKTPTLNLIFSRWMNSKKSNLGSFNSTKFRIQSNILPYFYFDEIDALKLAKK